MTPTLIIAEAGVNHNGDLALALQLIDAAAEAGADIVKFQTFKTENLVSAQAAKAGYQIANTGDEDSTQFSMLKKLELSEADHLKLIAHCQSRGIRFLSTAFDPDSLRMLRSFGIDLFKIPSGEITNLPYLRDVASDAKEVILSTGMCTMQEIREAVDTLERHGLPRNRITILHCNTDYPTPMHDANLLAMGTIQKTFGVKVGISDHTLGIEVPIAAVALGASVVEKHFTLDRSLPGPDHAASLVPAELKVMVSAIRNIELALGDPDKRPTSSEIRNRAAARKSIHLAASLAAGHVLEERDLVMKRPGDGISPMELPSVVGRKLVRSVAAGSKLCRGDLA